ncbi:hypothetical protein R6Q59_028391 [Mikania micrantha]
MAPSTKRGKIGAKVYKEAYEDVSGAIKDVSGAITSAVVKAGEAIGLIGNSVTTVNGFPRDGGGEAGGNRLSRPPNNNRGC